MHARAAAAEPHVVSARRRAGGISGWPSASASNSGPSSTSVGKRIGRMLVGVGRHRRQRFELADRAQPVVHRGAVGAVPAIDRDRQLLRQQQDVGDRREHQVVRRVEPRHHAPELRDPLRRRHAVGEERCLQRRQARRAEALDLDPRQQTGEQTRDRGRAPRCRRAPVRSGGCQAMAIAASATSQKISHRTAICSANASTASATATAPQATSMNATLRANPIDGATRPRPRARRCGRSRFRRPARRGLRGNRRCGAARRPPAGEPAPRRRSRPRRATRPASPRPLRSAPCSAARTATRGRTDRDRARTDDRREMRAVAAGSGPPTVQAFESAEVDALGAAGALDPFQHARVDDGQRGERAAGGDRPPRRQRRADEREPERERQQRGQQQPAVRQPQVAAIERGQALAPGRQAALVFSAGRRGGVGQS